MSGLLAAKLHRPTPPPHAIRRPHLIQRLTGGLQAGRPITLVSAPAGFGKTTCISEWLNHQDLPAAWLSLDPADDDPGRFFTHFVAALQQVSDSLGQEIEGLLRAGQLPPAEAISAALINDILAMPGRFLLVLDDFQVIQDRTILQVFEQMAASLFQAGAQAPLHLVLLTREDPTLPLGRLRAGNRLTEIRAADLRFTSDEAARFLNEAMSLSLSPADVAALEERTEGWIAGLQLAALALQAPSPGLGPSAGRPDPSAFIAALSGSHRYILSYLTEEVLNRQPPEVQDFLLQTSLLERLSGALCDAVTGRNDSASLLERLLAANLFLIPLDDEARWYRYHHLFAGLLRSRQNALHRDQAAGLHRRASAWYDQAGMAPEAVEHALAAADYPRAVELLEKIALPMILQAYVRTVDCWLQAIPREYFERSARINMACAWMNLLRGTFSQATPYIERLEAMFSGPSAGSQDPSLLGEWLAIQSKLLSLQGRPAESRDLADRALQIQPRADAHVRSMLLTNLAMAYQQLLDYDGAAGTFERIVQDAREAGNFVLETLGASGQAQMLLQQGRLHLAFETASEGASRLEASGKMTPFGATLYGELGQIYYHWRQLDQARAYLQRSMQLSGRSGYSDPEIYYSLMLSRMQQMEGDWAAAAQEMQKALELARSIPPAMVREEVISQQVRVDLANGRPAAAQAILLAEGFRFEEAFAFPDLPQGQGDLGGPITHPLGLLYNSALRFLLFQANAKQDLAILRSGIDLAGLVLAGELQCRHIPIALETLLLRSQMHAVLGDEQNSLADVARALELAEPEGFISIFVEAGPPVERAIADLLRTGRPVAVQPDYARRILAAFPTPASPAGAPAGAGSPALLSERELDVLRLMADGQTYEEIASHLYISVNTVRSHVKAIYGRLGANNRTRAIELARSLGLI